MSIVGLTERYTESVILMAELLGLPAPDRLPNANVNPQRTTFAMRYRDQLDADIVTQLEELDRWDLELYAQATEIFAAQWARYQARPQRTYSIAAHVRPVLQPVKAIVKRVIRRRP
jgi:phage terminase small subunit